MSQYVSKKAQLANQVYEVLANEFPDAKCSLNYETPLDLLIATQLAAQCTDARVNIVTENLFKKYKSAQDYAMAELEQLEEDIRSTGFYKNKAQNIKKCCEILVEQYDGAVPNKMEHLLKLPGVGRKTANVVLGEIFNVPGVVIDTHAGRISRKIGLTKQVDPVKVEYEIMKLLSDDKWNNFCHYLIELGRSCCTARKQYCEKCCINHLCKSSTLNE